MQITALFQSEDTVWIASTLNPTANMTAGKGGGASGTDPGILNGGGPAEFSSKKKGGGGPTTYLGAICITKKKQKKKGVDPLDLPLCLPSGS